MIFKKFFQTFICSTFFLIAGPLSYSQYSENENLLSGNIKIDSTWSSKIYLSYVPTFEDMYSMSGDMIIAETDIKPNGNFAFNLDYLPKEDKLYRLHVIKKTDTKSSLIIGGKSENFLLLIANKNSSIVLEANNILPPFRNTSFTKENSNIAFQKITNLINKKDSLASVSNAYKRKFLKDKLKSNLLKIADTSSNPLVSMYAIYKSDFEIDFAKNKAFYESFSEKWAPAENSYFKKFNEKVSEKQANKTYYHQIILGVICIIIGFIIGKYLPLRQNRIKNLSVQERKVFDLLKKGASNKEISKEFNIGISTVKSHVSSILSKMNVKSRKELMKTK